MAFVLKDRVRETSTTTGTSDFDLTATADFDEFSDHMSHGDTCWYAAVLGAEWEVGIGTKHTPGSPAVDQLLRTTILASSNGGAKVSFSAGTKDVFMNTPAPSSNTSWKQQSCANIGAAYLAGTNAFTDATDATDATTGGFTLAGGLSIAKKLFTGLAATIGGVLKTTDTTDAASPTTGALQSAGGLGVVKKSYFGDNMRLEVATNSNPSFRFAHGGGLLWDYIGVASTGAFIVANAAASGGVQLANQSATAWSAFSDRRIKEEIEEISVLDMLGSFRAVRFKNKLNGETELGVIAQEQIDAFPELVHPGAAGDDAPIKDVMDPRLWSVIYDRYGIVALQGVKELVARVQELERRLAASPSVS